MASTQAYALLCLENPLLDIQGQGDEAMLAKYGLKPNDAILAEEKHMALYEDLLQNHSAKLIAGGAAQNTTRGAQYILPPHSTLYIGCVGADKYATTLRTKNEEAGVRSEYLVSPDQPTGRCGVIITGHDRSMCTHLAAANEYKLSHLQSAPIWALVQQAGVYFVGGYHLTVCVPAILALAEEAARADKVFVMSLSAPFIPLFFKEQLALTSKYWDYVIGNETEARSWAEGQGLETRDVKEIARLVAELPKENKGRKRTVVFTQGTESTVVAVQGEEGVKEFGIKEVKKEDICDTNGAG
ncbi:adenosine kinase [Imshaugia aleurites]|uniref:Adenosine kinase n=1 Tax=Imshaugia aleurites TaxID=172621 RepID=A0A8H3ECT2_9LECA|nr:adenosine kinase [Imshaugia aleurites]